MAAPGQTSRPPPNTHRCPPSPRPACPQGSAAVRPWVRPGELRAGTVDSREGILNGPPELDLDGYVGVSSWRRRGEALVWGAPLSPPVSPGPGPVTHLGPDPLPFFTPWSVSSRLATCVPEHVCPFPLHPYSHCWASEPFRRAPCPCPGPGPLCTPAHPSCLNARSSGTAFEHSTWVCV